MNTFNSKIPTGALHEKWDNYKADAKLILDYKTALNLNGVTTRTTVPSGATPTTTSGSTNAPHPAQMQLYGVLETLANIGKS